MSQKKQTILEHVKAKDFINEYIDRFSLVGLNNGSSLQILLTVGRDTLDVTKEYMDAEKTENREVPEGGIRLHRLDFATVAMSVESAKALGEALVKIADQAPEKD